MAMTEQTRAYFDAHFAPETEQLWANNKSSPNVLPSSP